jgi:hypothetical protein
MLRLAHSRIEVVKMKGNILRNTCMSPRTEQASCLEMLLEKNSLDIWLQTRDFIYEV